MYLYISIYIYIYIYICIDGPGPLWGLSPNSDILVHFGVSQPYHWRPWSASDVETCTQFASVAFETPPEHDWLVVLIILKHISQWEGLSHILWTIKHVWNHQPDEVVTLASPSILGTYNIPRSPSKIQRYLQWKYLKWHLNGTLLMGTKNVLCITPYQKQSRWTLLKSPSQFFGTPCCHSPARERYLAVESPSTLGPFKKKQKELDSNP